LLRAGTDRLAYEDSSFAVARRAPRWFAYETSLKRLLDVVLASLGLVASLPLSLAIIIAIKLDSPGPALFVQERVGRYGHHFRFYKFRSMYVDAERRLSELQMHNEVDGPVFKMRKDPRISKVGAFLRRSSLDEMSLVGPRPPLPREVEQYRPSDKIRLSVKPGLTCLWQIRGRSTLGFDTWMEYDREYISNVSLWVDLSILVRTVWAVLSTRGAY